MSDAVQLNEWRELVCKLVSLRIGPPRKSHDVDIVEFATEGGKPTRRAIYASEDSEHVADALVTAIDFWPHEVLRPSPRTIERSNLILRFDVVASRVPLATLKACVEQCEREAEPLPDDSLPTEEAHTPLFAGGRFSVTLQLLTETAVVIE